LVRSDRREARLAIVEGIPRAAATPESGDTLGDLLSRQGLLDGVAHAKALGVAAPVGPVGRWLVDVGAASPEAVEGALEEQLTDRVVAILAWPSAELRFRAGLADVGVAHVTRAREPADLVLAALRSAVAEVPAVRARKRLGDGLLVLSRLGRSFTEAATLGEEERAMLPLLGEGAPVDVVLAAAGSSPRAIRALYALWLLSAVSAPTAGRRYSVLLRKQRQLRRAAGATRLLDLPHDADAPAARRALRRLAGDVHPDRFAAGEAPAVKRASEEVMAALVVAVGQVRR